MTKNMAENDIPKCPICMDFVIEAIELQCGHLLCDTCCVELNINAEYDEEYSCPQCRAPIKETKQRPDISELVKNHIGEAKYNEELKLRQSDILDTQKSIEDDIVNNPEYNDEINEVTDYSSLYNFTNYSIIILYTCLVCLATNNTQQPFTIAAICSILGCFVYKRELIRDRSVVYDSHL